MRQRTRIDDKEEDPTTTKNSRSSKSQTRIPQQPTATKTHEPITTTQTKYKKHVARTKELDRDTATRTKPRDSGHTKRGTRTELGIGN